MLLKYALVLAAAASTVAPTSVPRKKVELTSQIFKTLLAEALENANIYRHFSPITLAILQAFQKDLDICRGFSSYICEKYPSLRNDQLKNSSKFFWPFIAGCYFLNFSREHPDEAVEIVNQVLIPSHPFAAELKDRFDVQNLSESFPGLPLHFSRAVEKILSEQFHEIFIQESSLEDAQAQFFTLMEKYEKSIWPENQILKFSCAFLKKAPFESTKKKAVEMVEQQSKPWDNINNFAFAVYEQVDSESPEQAQRALRDVMPEVYDQSVEKNYCSVIEAYLDRKK